MQSTSTIFDRTWRPGHPFRPRLCNARRWGMFCLLCFLCCVIGAYLFLTDEHRVRVMAESYLTRILGGRVQVKRATLSIFEGLRLDGVRVYADEPDSNRRAGGGDDSPLFSASSFFIKYSPDSILSGALEATEIVAIDPDVILVEDLDTGHWNFDRMRPRTGGGGGGGGGKPAVLPQVSLRNGQIAYRQFQSGKLVVGSGGSMSIDGSLTPGQAGSNDYAFRLQSRGESSDLGPVVTGQFNLKSKELRATLLHFEFGRDVLCMLPPPVRQWWVEHELSGTIDVPHVTLIPAANGKPPQFSVLTRLTDVTLAAWPEEWSEGIDAAYMRSMRTGFDLMRLAGLNGKAGGFGIYGSEAEPVVAGEAQLASARTPRPPAVASQVAPFVDCLESIFKPNVRFEKVSGELYFDQDKIDISSLRGQVEGNPLNVFGSIRGYSPHAAADVTLEGDGFTLQELPHYLGSMPKPIKDLLLHLRPHGVGNVSINLNRPSPGARAEIRGTINITDGGVCFDGFPYPMRRAHGTITFSPDDEHPHDKDAMKCALVGITGQGVAGGPNADRTFSVDANIAPLNGNNEVSITIVGNDLVSEPAMMNALPRETREALGMFDPTGTGALPTFHGDVVCKINRPYGPYKPFTATLDLDVRQASGAFKPFPYPIRNLHGKLHVEEDHVDIIGATMSRPVGEGTATTQSTLTVDGTVKYGRGVPLMPTLSLSARNLPVDGELLAAIPAPQRAKLTKLGVSGGYIDVDGKIYRDPKAAPETRPTTPGVAIPEDLCFDQTITLRGVNVAPGDGGFVVRDVYGKVDVAGGKAILSDFRGRRGDSALTGRGTVRLPKAKGDEPQFSLAARVTNLTLDEALYKLLPDEAKGGWDSLAPVGVVDAELAYGPDEVPADGEGQGAGGLPFVLSVHPHDLTATVEAVPYKLDGVNGTLVVRPQRVLLQDITARHGGAKIAVSGTGYLAGPATRPTTRPAERTIWDLRLVGQDLPVDDDLRAALPPAVAKLMKTLKLSGKVSVDFTKLAFFGGEPLEGAAKPPAPRAANRGTKTKPAKPAFGEPDLDLAGTIAVSGGAMDVGIPLSDVEGRAAFTSHVRAGKLADVSGTLDFDRLRAADRPIRQFRADVKKPAGLDAMRLERMQARVAGGEAGGQVEFSFPDAGASRFAVNFVMRNLDVRELTREADAADGTSATAPANRQAAPQIQGQLSASLALEGAWGDRTTHRGRGDVLVSGRELYKIPLMMGLLQITNLSLPITSPFREATARYLVEGQRVTFEQIELSAPNMRMQGGGWLDYASHKVRLTFSTDNPHWPKVPVLTELIDGAKHELLQIHVTGTIQDPKVSASMFSTLTTTVDEVTKGR